MLIKTPSVVSDIKSIAAFGEVFVVDSSMPHTVYDTGTLFGCLSETTVFQEGFWDII